MERNWARMLATAAVVSLGLTIAGTGAFAEGEKDGGKRVEKHVLIRHPGSGGFLGVGLADLEADARGAKVRSVEPDSPAGKAGLKEGDVVVRFDGEAVKSASQLARLVRETPAGRSVPVEVERNGAAQTLRVTVGEGDRLRMLGEPLPGMQRFHLELPEPPEAPEAPDAEQAPDAPEPPRAPHPPLVHGNRFYQLAPQEPRRLGIEFLELGEQLAAHYKLAGKSGVLVSSVDADGAAAKGGVKAGDIVLALDGQEITDGRDLRNAVVKAQAGKPIAIKVQRDGRPLELRVTLPGPKPARSGAGGVTL